MGWDGKADCVKCAYFAIVCVVGMLSAFVIKGVDGIQFFACLIESRRILNKIAVAVFLGYPLCRDRVVIFLVGVGHFDKFHFVFGGDFIGWHFEIIFSFFFGDIAQTACFVWVFAVTQRSSEF